MKKVIIVVIAILAISILLGIYTAHAQDSTKTDSVLVANLKVKYEELQKSLKQIEIEINSYSIGDTVFHIGKQGGKYYFNKAGRKVYVKK